MEIRIEEILENSRFRFSNPNVSGVASFVPSQSNSHPEIGDTYIMEVDQKSVSAFKQEQPLTPLEIKALQTAGDYSVVAVIDNRWEDGAVAVVGDLRFMLDASDIDEPFPRENDVVSFVLHGLVLYDTDL